jgi:ABC-type molybdenum transport system ATPase subunit/photorepair protein PhrA
MGLAGQAAIPTENLSEPLRRLALYALVFYQRPRLLLLERPFQFLDRDFRLVWGLIQDRVAAGELAVAVFDRASDIYPPGSFHNTASFKGSTD